MVEIMNFDNDITISTIYNKNMINIYIIRCYH